MKKTAKVKYIIIIGLILVFAMINIINPFSKSELDESDTPEDMSEISLQSDGFYFSGGNGTSEEPYEIATKEELKLLAELVNSHTVDTTDGKYYTTKYYKLIQDIDLNNEEWTPIGSSKIYNINYAFQGNFNGNGYVISNIRINVNSLSAEKEKYGLFGYVDSNNSNSRAMIYNLEVENMNISVAAQGVSGQDLAIGGIVGLIGKNTSIINCIIRNSNINVNTGFILGAEKLLAIGGIVGDISDNASTVKGSAMCKIENCFSNLNIIVDDDEWEDGSNSNRYYQFNLGGIVGRIRSQAQFPTKCIYTGTIKANHAFIGPIYACTRYDTANSGTRYYDNTYAGLNSGGGDLVEGAEVGYFYNYKIRDIDINKVYKDLNEIKIGNVTVHTLGTDYMSRVEGVNRGEIIEGLIEGCEILNSFSGIGSNYNQYYYDDSNDTLTFDESVSCGILVENQKYNYEFKLKEDYSEENITYKWYIDDLLQKETTKSITLSPSINRRILKIELYLDNQLMHTTQKGIEPETLNMYIAQKRENDKKVIYVRIDSTLSIGLTDYQYQWYKKNGENFEKIEGQTDSQYEVNLQNGDNFKLIAIHKQNQEFNQEIIYTYSDAIYVCSEEVTVNEITYKVGTDTNEGNTPETAVNSLEKAYELLSDYNTKEENTIIIIGKYEKYIPSTTFNKPATIVGKYMNTDYEGTLCMGGSLILLNADTVFKDMTLRGAGENFNMYCEGNSLTIDKGCKVENFGNAGWGVTSNRYPGLSIIGGFFNYEDTMEIPQTTSNIIIKSGHYGRIVAGSRSGADYGYKQKSDLCGTETRPQKVIITIDIEEEVDSQYEGHIGYILGGQADGSCFMSAEINVINGKIATIAGGSLGIGNDLVGDAPRDSYFGSTTINIKGGKIGELYGGSFGRSAPTAYYYGKIVLNITGGTINNVYGAGAGGTTGYSDNSTDKYKSYAKNKIMYDLQGNSFKLEDTTVEINISDNAQINGSIYGGGYGYSVNLTKSEIADDGGALYGDTTINITGGKIFGNIYGGGRGSDKYGLSKDHLACVDGKIIINISGTPQITGNVYGGGEGVEGFPDMAKVSGTNPDENTITIDVDGETEINGDIYGGGSIAQTIGDIELNINMKSVTNIYGGGNRGSVDGNTTLNIQRANIKENILGGGNKETCKNTEINLGSRARQVAQVTVGGNIYGGNNSSEMSKEKAIENVNINIYADIEANVYGGCNTTGLILYSTNIRLQRGIKVIGDVYGAGYGENSQVGENDENKAKITIDITENAKIYGNVHGGGYGGKVYGPILIKLKDAQIGTNDVAKNIYGGGEGKTAVVNGTTTIDIAGSTVYGTIYGGGNAGDVLENTDIKIYDGSNITQTIYGGGNQANIGNEQKNANTNVVVYDADIGQILGTELIGGEVFGGGNNGKIYGDTKVTVGSVNDEIITNIGEQFYAGGKGTPGVITVTGNSNGTIAGSNTEVKAYGDISLGAVEGEVNITFKSYKKNSASNKYKNMTGINKATNLYLIDSYVYLTGGLKDIVNLYIPEQSGIMISEDSEILGNFTGGGVLYLQNEVCLTIDGDITKDSNPTRLTLSPELLEEEKYYIIRGNVFTPYIKVLGTDYTNGSGIFSGNQRKYDIYSLNLEDNNSRRYNATSRNFKKTGNSDENGEIYINSVDETDTRKYYYDESISKFYLLTDDLELEKNNDVTANEGKIDSIYYAETTIVIPNYASIRSTSVPDKVYNRSIENESDVYILGNGAFTSEFDVSYTMIKTQQDDGTWEYMYKDDFLNIRRSIYLSTDVGVKAFPNGTNIVMIINDHYYMYQIPENFGTEEFWREIGEKENFGNQLPLILFKDENGNNYTENIDIQNRLECGDALIRAIWETDEDFKFIFDFSECETYLTSGIYNITLGLIDSKPDAVVESEKEIYTEEISNSIQIDNRNLRVNIEKDKELYGKDEIINITGYMNLDRLSVYNSSDLGKDISVRISLLDANNNKINFPKATILTINEQQCNISTDYLTVKLIEGLTQRNYYEDFNVKININDALFQDKLPDGKYSINFDFYTSKNDALLGKYSMLSKNIDFEIKRNSNYGIKIVSVEQKDEENSDQIQLVAENKDVSKTVNLQFEKGNLEDGAYILVKTYKRKLDGSFEYLDLGETIAVEQKIINPSKNVQSHLIFDATLENGTYRIEYEVVDKENKVVTKTHINFIVNR